jgi:hypothetical protein
MIILIIKNTHTRYSGIDAMKIYNEEEFINTIIREQIKNKKHFLLFGCNGCKQIETNTIN